MKSWDTLLGHPYPCACGGTHMCGIERVVLGRGALAAVGELAAHYKTILLVADANTYRVCGQQVQKQLTAAGKAVSTLVYKEADPLLPDNAAVALLEEQIGADTELVLGVGSGVINDLCKHGSWRRGLPYVIVATAPSMDGYASSGAALLLDGMKVTVPARPPAAILADTAVLREAPFDMLRAGFGDTVGKFSALNDWKLGSLLTGEPFCQGVADLVMEAVNEVVGLADGLAARREESVEALMAALITVGVAMSYAGNSRPASGSEHHLSHFFELTGIERRRPYLLHGIDVGYATVMTCRMREQALRGRPITAPLVRDAAAWEAAVGRVFGAGAPEIRRLQAGGLEEWDLRPLMTEKWDDIRAVLREAPAARDVAAILASMGYGRGEFLAAYGEEWIRQAVDYARYTKTIYTLLWLLRDVEAPALSPAELLAAFS